eukprot:CAMPEP_0206009990 /NCGR_PEP_ID=MMETSP1464-20131121/10769_1 /ASSEMBLY_ACC=CAM_ASM_001124 /TAXON_ID=119497 /ORGANISM="Exanthemachrysis gayraliae, Strain RCC1523" /LENGTH=77 /DNA_ID=CAMNT_0053383599 /DNA_START=130 /DNA_END=360 /DNA_ORIENTATION=-
MSGTQRAVSLPREDDWAGVRTKLAYLALGSRPMDLVHESPEIERRSRRHDETGQTHAQPSALCCVTQATARPPSGFG